MRIGFVIFDSFTALDFIGVYDPLIRLKALGAVPELAWEICAPTAEARDGNGQIFTPTQVGAPLVGFDLVIVAGGFATRHLMHDPECVCWVQTMADCPLKVSVCTGALLLGAAGFLAGKRATTHPTAFDLLAPYCAQVVDQRIVDEGDVITARGVTSSIDLGLYLAQKLGGAETANRIRRQMDYPYGEA